MNPAGGEQPALHNLRVMLSSFRKVCPDVDILTTDDESVALNPAVILTDCSASYQLCVTRRRSMPNPSCVSEVGGGKLAESKSTGCWQDAPCFGGQRVCGLRG
ncbi:MAG: hypothetical protein J0H42_23870 [Rhizobiales bacterium]|nr:hypothetical protein [Hyphomicrobiales bacterium]